MCAICDATSKPSEDFLCNECDQPLNRACPRCGGSWCPDCDEECFWCASGLGPAADLGAI